MTEVETSTKRVADTVKSMIESYQAKWTNIAKENMQFAADFGQALSTVHTPTEWLDVTTEYSKKRFEVFQRHVKDLMSSHN